MLSLKRTVRVLLFIYRKKQWKIIGWYWRAGYFHKPKTANYLDSDNGTDSWCVNTFCYGEDKPQAGKSYTLKELKEKFGFRPWLGAPPQAGRYHCRNYGERS